jgi:hypothetical protein
MKGEGETGRVEGSRKGGPGTRDRCCIVIVCTPCKGLHITGQVLRIFVSESTINESTILIPPHNIQYIHSEL